MIGWLGRLFSYFFLSSIALFILFFPVMAQVYDLKSCIIWETDQPSRSMSRQSSNFRLFGEEWFLKLESFNSYDQEFHVRLCSRNGCNETIKAGVSVTCHIIVDGKAFGCEKFSVRNPGDVIFRFRVPFGSVQVSGSQKWKLYCHFGFGGPFLPLNISYLSTGLSLTTSIPSVQTCPEIPPNLQLLSNDFSRMLDKEIIPDATMTCGAQTWKVHRSILAARSEVFAAMFRSGMAESETGAVKIEDLEPTVLDSLLKYVYGGKVPDLSGENVSGLYKAADKYALHGLKKHLSSWIAGHLSQENCLGFLVAADAHSDVELKKATVAFIATHFTEIKKAVWTKFRKEHLHLVVEVLERFAPAMKK